MKKVFSALLLVGFLTGILLPIIASADVTVGLPKTCAMKRSITVGDITCTGAIDLEGPNSICCLMNTIYNVTDWIFVILVGVAALFVIIGAMQLLMSAGDPEKTKAGRSYIMWAFIGLIIALLAKAMPGLVRLVSGI